MNESSKTIAFIAVAASMVGLAVASHFMNRPKIQQDFELVGQPFYEEFNSSEQAAALEVAAVDADDVSRQQFIVKKEDGLWRIPSHHNYPAEAAVRLAETATSVMGIERETLAGRLASDHEKLGVVDPLSDVIEDPAAAGKRITLKDDDGEVLVDYIIGKEAGDVFVSDTERRLNEGGIPQNYFYVRRPDEQQTYKVKLDVDLSTRFSDWIDPDLLRLDQNKLTRILIDNYSLEEERSNPLGQVKSLFKSQGDRLELTRNSSSEPWTLVDLKAETEELQAAKINGMIEVLSGIRIAGVRPKFKYQDHLLLTPDLQLNRRPEFDSNPQEFGRAITQLQNELEDKGFNLAGSSEKLELVSQQGQLDVGTNDGVLYSLQFGKEVLGEEAAIEIGSGDESEGAPQADELSEDSEPNQDDPAAEQDEADAEAEAEAEGAKNRYLMIRVSFDESLVGERPVKPAEPTKPSEPEGYAPPPTTEEGAGNSESSDEPSPGEDSVEAPDAEPKRKPEFLKYDQELAAYEQQKVDYELATTKFEQDLKEFEKKVEDGQKLVDELNERFADWYYVITANNLKTMQTTRKDLVTVKEPAEGEPVVDDVSPELEMKPNITFPASEMDIDAGSESNSADENGSVEGSEGTEEPAAESSDGEENSSDGEEESSDGEEKSSDGEEDSSDSGLTDGG